MNPAPAFSARGQRGGWTHRRKLYYGAFVSLTRWARQQFALGVERVAWEDASRHLRDAYPDLYDAAVALGRHRTPPILQRAQAAAQGAAGQVVAPAQQPQPSTPSSPSSTTTVSTIKAAAPSTAVTQTATGPADQAATPKRLQPEPQLRARPVGPPPTHQHQGRAGGGTKL